MRKRGFFNLDILGGAEGIEIKESTPSSRSSFMSHCLIRKLTSDHEHNIHVYTTHTILFIVAFH